MELIWFIVNLPASYYCQEDIIIEEIWYVVNGIYLFVAAGLFYIQILFSVSKKIILNNKS